MNCFIHTRDHLPQIGEPSSETANCEEYDIEEEESSDQPEKHAWSWGSRGGLQSTIAYDAASGRLRTATAQACLGRSSCGRRSLRGGQWSD